MTQARGFTLIELGIVVVLVAAIAVISGGMVVTLRTSERRTRAYADDITGLRRAVRAIETDLRANRSDTCRLVDGELLRGDVVLARRIGRFEIHREGDVWVARIGMKPRRESGQARKPVVTVRVRPREQGR